MAEFGFNVIFIEKIGSLSARGSKMSHTFYLYASTSTGSTPDKYHGDMVAIVEIAGNKEKRFEAVTAYMKVVLESGRPNR
jgi:hypothetical protein